MEKGGEAMKKLVVFVCLMILACCALSAQIKEGPSKCEKKAQVLLDKVLEMWNQGNLALIPELYTADSVATTSTFPEPFVGHEGIRKWVELSRSMFPDMLMTFDEVMATPGRIATIWTISATQSGPLTTPMGVLPPSGKKVRFTGMSIDYLKDGKMAKEIVIYNVLEAMMQMGFTIAPPPAPAAR